jgi:4-amino-4-deoxy-L-arabinose transferase-like glycosyltransferase
MPAALVRHPLLLILAAALALRLVAAVGVQAYLDREGRTFLIPGDAEGYWALAGKIAAGDDYAVYDPPRRVLRMPCFPMLLAAVRAVTGEAFVPVRLVLAVVGTAACGAVYLLGRTLDSERSGLIAATAAAFWPAFIGFSVLVLSETLFALMLTLSLAAMAKLVRSSGEAVSRRVVWGGAVGILIVLASYVRPTWLPAAGVFPLLYWLWAGRTKAALLVGFAIALTAAATLTPWVIRNQIVTERLVPTTLWVGPSLYDGLNPNATGESDMQFFDEENLLARMSEYDMDREYRRRAWDFVRENPGRTVELAFIKLWRYWRPWPGAEQFSSPAARFVVAAYYLPILAFAVAGAWLRRRDLWLVGLSAGPILFFSVVHCVFVGSLRYRLPAEYPLCVLSAVGLQALLKRRFA